MKFLVTWILYISTYSSPPIPVDKFGRVCKTCPVYTVLTEIKSKEYHMAKFTNIDSAKAFYFEAKKQNDIDSVKLVISQL